MNKSETIGALAAALSKAQSKFIGAKADSSNPYFKSKYADLSSVWDSVREALTENGLSVCQFPSEGPDGCIMIETILMHSSGEFISGSLPMPVLKKDPQSYGSTVTYGRRYALQSILSVPSIDDDAEGAMDRNGKHPTPTPPTPPVPTPPPAQGANKLTKEAVAAELGKFKTMMNKCKTLDEAATKYRTYTQAMQQVLAEDWSQFEQYKDEVKLKLSLPKEEVV